MRKKGLVAIKKYAPWLYTVHNLDVTYKVVHDTVRYRLKAKLKVPRRSNVKKDAEAEAEFKKKFQKSLKKNYYCIKINEINIKKLDIGYKMNPDLDCIL